MGRPKQPTGGQGSRRKRRKKKEKNWFTRLLTFGIIFTVLYVAANAAVCWMLVGPNNKGLMLQPNTRGVSVGEVEFEASDGVTLRGWFSKTEDRPCIILAHGRGAHRGQFRDLYCLLYLNYRMGFLAFDFRASGNSDGRVSSGGILEARDLEAAIRWVKKQGYGDNQIGLVAMDMGVVAAVEKADIVDDLAAVVLVGAGEDPYRQLARRLRKFHLPTNPTVTLALKAGRMIAKAPLAVADMEGRFKQLASTHLLMVSGENDELAPPELIKGRFQLIPNDHKYYVELKGCNHEDLMRMKKQDLSGQIARFFKRVMID